MKKLWRKGLSFILAVLMVAGLFPTTAFAAVDSTGRPKDVNNALVLSIYTGTGFPGEPAVYGTSNYKNINSRFAVQSGATFANSANGQLDWTKIQRDIVQGTTSGNTSVWGVYDANGTKEYFLSNASIIQPENEAKMIQTVKTETKNMSAAEVLQRYEIVWYVIKLQHSAGSGWFGRATTEWHIDGVIKEKEKISINYYGNGNTSGAAPLGTASHISGNPYTVLDKNTMVKKINGVEVAFLGWSAKADGTGEEEGFYLPGTVINPTKSISLYAMWDTTTQHTATVNTYLDDVLTDADDVHGTERNLCLSTDEEHYHSLSRTAEGVYTAQITGNGKFRIYNKNADGTYTRIGNYQLTIYNQNGSLDIYHYSVTYDLNGGNLETDSHRHGHYFLDDAVTAVTDVPTKEGYRFLGWKDNNGNLFQPGEIVTEAISAPITLTAQWEKTVDVRVNVTINHVVGEGYDFAETKDDVFMSLVSRANNTSAYLETGDTLTLNDASHAGFTFSESKEKTEYTATGPTFTDLPGGSTEYTVVTGKSCYDTSVEAVQDADGNWVIDVVMTYNPDSFDLNFTVEVDEDVPSRYLPVAAIVKVTFWDSERNLWKIITQQEGGKPGVRVDIDPDTRSGSGTYPVWKHEPEIGDPYGYRIQVASFVYPNGTIVPASEIVQENMQWTDTVYTATLEDVSDGKKYGTLDGAYYSDDNGKQAGTLNAVIDMELYSVTFDAQGGKVNGQDVQLVEEQYKVPGFKGYAATREGGYTFGGWYKDEACTIAATEGEDLTEDITLYAKWIEPLTISGTVTISGTYEQNGETVSVHDIDRAAEAVVVLQELRNGAVLGIDSQTVSFGSYGATGSGEYSFTGIPNDGKTYQIYVLELNYETTYDNESDAGISYTADEFAVVFGDDNVAKVDAYLKFVPGSYVQELEVDATHIGDGFRPRNVLSEVLYRDTGDNQAFQRISQHSVAPYGVQIGLNAGLGNSSESVWEWHTDGTLYEYQMNITAVDGTEFDSDTAPFYIIYAEPAYWDSNAGAPSGKLKATLIPNEYSVIFDLNAGTDAVTGMEAYLNQETETYEATHVWSFAAEINALPAREGYNFLGWETAVEGVTADETGKVTISADVWQDVVLKAKWEKVTYTVATACNPAEGGTVTGAGTYDHGSEVTVEATPAAGYRFVGWYENDALVSEELSYSFEIFGNREFTAKFDVNRYTVTTAADPAAGGTTSGDGSYALGTNVTVTAAANESYQFAGWYENGEKVSDNAEYTFAVTGDHTLTAKFTAVVRPVYNIRTSQNIEDAGTVTGAGTYAAGTEIVLRAEANEGYLFTGWFEENGKLITTDQELKHVVVGNKLFKARYNMISVYKNSHAYIFGYNDSVMGAEGPLLRSEAAVMVHRLAKQNNERGDFVYNAASPSFTDIAGTWFQCGIEYIHHKGGFSAPEGSKVSPYVQITRGEVFKIVSLGLGFTDDATLTFDEYGAALAARGYIVGSGGSGNLDSGSLMTRAEFCTMYNRIIGRENALLVDANGNEITAETYGFTDLNPKAWYYQDMLRATSAYDENGFVDLSKRAQRNVVDDYS